MLNLKGPFAKSVIPKLKIFRQLKIKTSTSTKTNAFNLKNCELNY